MSQISIEVGKRIKMLRNAIGLSQEQLAFKANLNTAYIGHVERAEKIPSVETLYKIATGLNISLAELLDFENDYYIKNPLGVSDKIAFYLSNRDEKDQEAILEILKRIIEYKDSGK